MYKSTAFIEYILNHCQPYKMISQVQCSLLLALLSQVLADYLPDYADKAATYTNYNTYYTNYGYAYNNSLTSSSPRNKRIFNDIEDFDYRLGMK